MNNVIAVVASFLSVSAIFVDQKLSTRLVASSCGVGLCMPIYNIAYALVVGGNSSFSVLALFMATLTTVVFSPTSIILIVMLTNHTEAHDKGRRSVIALLCIVMSWFGIAAMHYALS